MNEPQKEDGPVYLKIGKNIFRFDSEAEAQSYELDQPGDLAPGHYPRVTAAEWEAHKAKNEAKNKDLEQEALALAAVMNLAPADRLPAIEKLNDAALELAHFIGEARREIEAAPNITPAALWAILERPIFRHDAERIKGADITLEGIRAADPQAARAALADRIAKTEKMQKRRQIETAMNFLEAAEREKDEAKADAIRTAAAHELTRQRADNTRPLAETWDTYRAERYGHGENTPQDAVMMDESRGYWAKWFNSWTGKRGGLEPGKTLIVGARPGGGKTSLAAALAVDAMAAGCPVLFYQLELSRGEAIEHLLAQKPGTGGRWWNEWESERCNQPLPPDWADLLTVPRIDSPEHYEADTIQAAMITLRRRSDRAEIAHKCRGLVIVDYAQLLTVHAARAATPQHEILTKAASMLAKCAADNGLALMLLSQLTKEAKKGQQEGKQSLEETALTGADLSRMAHVIFGLSHACKDKADQWTECGAREVTTTANGEARLLANMKRRGVKMIDGKWPDYTCPLWFSKERALHGTGLEPAPMPGAGIWSKRNDTAEQMDTDELREMDL